MSTNLDDSTYRIIPCPTKESSQHPLSSEVSHHISSSTAHPLYLAHQSGYGLIRRNKVSIHSRPINKAGSIGPLRTLHQHERRKPYQRENIPGVAEDTRQDEAPKIARMPIASSSQADPSGLVSHASLRRSEKKKVTFVEDENKQKEREEMEVDGEEKGSSSNESGLSSDGSELSDDENSEDLAETSGVSLRGRSPPPGEAGRPGRGGYTLSKVLPWEGNLLKRVKSRVNSEVDKHLDVKEPFSSQDEDKLMTIIDKITEEFPSVAEYRNAWPIRNMMESRIKYRRQHYLREKKVEQKVEQKVMAKMGVSRTRARVVRSGR